MLLPPPSALLTRIELDWDTDDGSFVSQAGRGSYRCICVHKQPALCWGGELNSTKILASAYNKDIQNTWHWSNSVYFTPGESAARLCRYLPNGWDPFAPISISTCSALFIVRGCLWSCCSLPAPVHQEQPSPKALSECPSPQGEAPPSPQPAQAHTDIPNRAWHALPRQEFSTVVSLTTDLARHYSGVNIPMLYFAIWPGQDPSFLRLLAHWELLRCQNLTAKWPFTPTTAIKQLAWI